MKMTNAPEIASVLERMADILVGHDRLDWAAVMRDLAGRIVILEEESGVRREIIRLFGGMASLNDIVFWPVDERRRTVDNEQFDALRTKLWDLSLPRAAPSTS